MYAFVEIKYSFVLLAVSLFEFNMIGINRWVKKYNLCVVIGSVWSTESNYRITYIERAMNTIWNTKIEKYC